MAIIGCWGGITVYRQKNWHVGMWLCDDIWYCRRMEKRLSLQSSCKILSVGFPGERQTTRRTIYTKLPGRRKPQHFTHPIICVMGGQSGVSLVRWSLGISIHMDARWNSEYKKVSNLFSRTPYRSHTTGARLYVIIGQQTRVHSSISYTLNAGTRGTDSNICLGRWEKKNTKLK